MAKLKQYGMAACTFSVALGIGFVMQNGDALASRFGADASVDEPAPFTESTEEEVSQVAPAEAAPVQEEIVIAQASVFEPQVPSVPTPQTNTALALPEFEPMPEQAAPVQLASLDTDLAPAAPVTLDVSEDVQAVSTMSCLPEMEATSGAAATVALSVSAPCHASQPFTIHHQGMLFTAMTDADGGATIKVPALAEVAVMIASFGDGDGAVATVSVPDFADYDRAVLQWQGELSIMLSAYEGDAEFGDAGHISAMNPGNLARLTAAEGGFLVQVGDASVADPLMAEIYTFPSGMIGDVRDVALVAEAEITAQNCGQEVTAQSIQVSPNGETSALDLVMTMPDCDAVGDVLILQNMFEDLTIASR